MSIERHRLFSGIEHLQMKLAILRGDLAEHRAALVENEEMTAGRPQLDRQVLSACRQDDERDNGQGGE